MQFQGHTTERMELDERVALSGKCKQEYMIQSSLRQKLVVVGDQRLFEKVEARLDRIEDELKRVVSTGAVNVEKVARLRTIVEIMQGMEE